MAARTRIKICGMTQPIMAMDAVKAGVDALGFIFVDKSPRKIDPDKAREIIAGLPPFVDAVGVFVDEEFEVVEEIVQYCGLTVVQLHGAEPVDYCERISCRVLKAFSIKPDTSPGQDLGMEAYTDVVSGFLLDTFHQKMAGGTGVTFDWSILEAMRPPGPLVLAGGLTPDNVGEAVKKVRPFAVDVNSGVEVEPGIKDIEKIRIVVDEVRMADQIS